MRKLLILATFLLLAGSAHAQWSTKWLAVGDFQHAYLSGAAEPENLSDRWVWPGIRPSNQYNHWKGLWVSVKDWTSETGKAFPYRNSHIGPRTLGLGEVFGVSHKLIARYPDPEVQVDGAKTFSRYAFVDEVDPNLPADRAVETIINTSVGVTVTRKPMAFTNAFHQNYHIIEYTFENTGNVDDDEQVELPQQQLKDVYFVLLDRPKHADGMGAWQANPSGAHAWGKYAMNDAVGNGPDDIGLIASVPGDDPNFQWRAQYSWLGWTPGRPYTTQGAPVWYDDWWNPVRPDSMGRLNAAAMGGSVVLCADGVAGNDTDCTDSPAQPRTMTYLESDWSDMTTKGDHNNEAQNKLERDWIERGSNRSQAAPPGANPRTEITQAYLVEPNGDFVNGVGDASLGKEGGWGYMNGFGPYNLAPGQKVKIVVAEGVAGLSIPAAEHVGRQYKLSAGADKSNPDENLEIPFDANGNKVIDASERLTKNEWVWSTRDSLFQTFRRARWMYNGGNYRTASEAAPPAPADSFKVVSGTDKITLHWDAGINAPGYAPAAKWQVWRAQKHYSGIVTVLQVDSKGLAVPDTVRNYELVHEETAGQPNHTWEDEDVVRGQSYYYYVVSVANAPYTDPVTGQKAFLTSSRYYGQTYEPAYLRRPAVANDLSKVRIVPNPYTGRSEPGMRFDQRDRMAFYGLPANATIKIFTEMGELVNTLEHTDGSGDEFWDMTTYSRQIVVSGVYIAVIKDNETGNQSIQKIIIIR